MLAYSNRFYCPTIIHYLTITNSSNEIVMYDTYPHSSHSHHSIYLTAMEEKRGGWPGTNNYYHMP